MRNYSYEDLLELTSLDNHKRHLLQMMDEFDQFCKENGLRYYLSGGTLLGAIRHKGFIPWDDDVDVNMPRPDCEKMMKLCGGRIGKYILNGPNYTESYHAYHWKLYDESILVSKAGADCLKEKAYPIFIDIFPIDGLPDTAEKNIKYFEKLEELKRNLNDYFYLKEYGGKNPIKIFKNRERIRRAECIGKEKLFKDVVDFQKSIDFDESDYIGVTSTNVHTVEERVVKSEYMPIIEVEFEGRMFPAPKAYDTYLRQLYGDNYMSLPPLHRRISRHKLIPFISKVDTSEVETFDWEKWSSSWCPGQKDIKIAICGLVKSENIGELFIARSLEYLIGSECRRKWPNINIEFVEVDLLGRNDTIENLFVTDEKKIKNYYRFSRLGLKTEAKYQQLKQEALAVDDISKKNKISKKRYAMWKHNPNYRARLEEFFENRLDGVDFIVVDGAGLLEYSYNEYEFPLMLISKYAEKNGLSIVYNAIGRAGEFDERAFGCKILKRALQSPSVKYVSARDNLDNVQACAGKKHNVKLLADAAFWMSETYGIYEQNNRKKIGIGLIRGTSLTGYGVKFDESKWIQLFASIAKELELRNYEYEFFTNGLPSDVVMGRKILDYLGMPYSKLKVRPVDDVELYNTINSYKALITCRMHSAIAAFTVGVPSVILSWNDKVEKLMNIIGYPERAITLENFNAQYIVDCMEKAANEGVEQQKIEFMKDKALESVRDYVDLILDVAKENR